MLSRLFRTAFLFLGFQPVSSLGRVLIRTDQIIDDTSSSVIYSPYSSSDRPQPCSSTSCPSSLADDIDFGQMIQGTMTSVAGRITIPFTGNAVSIFFATLHTFGVTIQIDGEKVGHFAQQATVPTVGNVLGYANTSITSGSHTLVLISQGGSLVDFDGLTFTSTDDNPMRTLPPPMPPTSSSSRESSSIPSFGSVSESSVRSSATALSFTRSVSSPTSSHSVLTTSSSGTWHTTSSTWQITPSSESWQMSTALSTMKIPSQPSSPPSQPAAKHSGLPSVPIVCGVVGGLSLLATLLGATLCLRHRARRGKTLAVHRPFSLIGESPRPRSKEAPPEPVAFGDNGNPSRVIEPQETAVPPSPRTPSRLANHLFRLEARFGIEALTSFLRSSDTAESSVRSAPPAYSNHDAAESST